MRGNDFSSLLKSGHKQAGQSQEEGGALRIQYDTVPRSLLRTFIKPYSGLHLKTQRGIKSRRERN